MLGQDETDLLWALNSALKDSNINGERPATRDGGIQLTVTFPRTTGAQQVDVLANLLRKVREHHKTLSTYKEK
jgi:hypothetical protein